MFVKLLVVSNWILYYFGQVCRSTTKEHFKYACRFLLSGFVLIHLHQGLLSSSPNVDVNETAIELDVAIKCSALHPSPTVQMLQRVMWQPNQRWAWPWVTLRMMMMMSIGSTYYDCCCDILISFCAMLSSLKSYHIFVVKQHFGSIVVSLIWKRRWQFFKNIMTAVALPYMTICQKRCFALYKVWQCVNWKYFSNSSITFNEWFSFWLESVEFLHSRHSSSVLLPDSEDWY